jgi:hypothetical protein
MIARVGTWWRRLRTAPAAPREPVVEPPPLATLTGDLAAAELAPSEWAARRRASAALYVPSEAGRVSAIRRAHHGIAERRVAEAVAYLRHEFDLLGSGPFRPVDPDRPADGSYEPIDWYLDPVRRLRFPRGVPYKAWNLYDMRPGNADIKYPWELSRCQHWAALGQAYLFTGDERFAREIVRELDDFVEANPVGVGVNWTCAMDVAIRAVNWAIGLDLVRGCDAIGAEDWMRACAALFEHGAFVRANLENTYEVTSNHFLSNVVGLWFLGAVFEGLPSAREWSAFARASLEGEMEVQVLPDGADFESSVPYHRLVAELFLASARLGRFAGVPLSPRFESRVGDMIGYLDAVLRPDGLMPQVGDADDGRLHVLGEMTTPQDPRHLFGPAAAMFARADWSALGGEAGAWEAAWWGLEPPPADGAARSAPAARLFPQAGLAVAREPAGHYLLVTNGIVGTNGFGNHKHQDELGFEYHVSGVPLVVDPGSFVYTSDGAERNRFRGTAYHNTVEIDGVEHNDMKPEWLFRLFERARAEHLDFLTDGEIVEYRGRQSGYERLPDPVGHERCFRFDRRTAALEIEDRLTGSGAHDLHWHFHLAPGVDIRPEDQRTFVLSAGPVTTRLSLPEGLVADVSPAWYSPAYGVRVPCRALDCRTRVDLNRAGIIVWTFRFR